MALIDTLAQAIATFEGFNVSGSIAQRNNNPGNLRSSPYATGTDANGYAIFSDAQTGWNALMYQLGLYSGRGMTIESMLSTYAPPADNNNNNANYLNYLTQQTGVGPSTSLSALYDSTGGVSTTIPDTTNTGESGFTTSDFLSSWIPSGDGGFGTGLAIGVAVLGISAWLLLR